MKGRVAITTADIAEIKGCSLRSAQRLLRVLRTKLKRLKGQTVFIHEFAYSENLKLADVLAALRIEDYPL